MKEIAEKEIFDNQKVTQLEEECEVALKKLEDGLNSALAGNLNKKLSSTDEGDDNVVHQSRNEFTDQQLPSQPIESKAELEDGEEITSPSKDQQIVNTEPEIKETDAELDEN